MAIRITTELMKLRHLLLLFLPLSLSFGQEIFHPEFPKDRVTVPDWLSVYTHLPDLVAIGVEKTDQPGVGKAASFTVKDTAPSDAAGKATYLRSRPLKFEADRIAVDWYDLVAADFPSPQFELWGKVGAQPNDVSENLILVSLRGLSVKVDNDTVSEVKPGWRHFRVLVSTRNNSFDFFIDDMDTPVASGIPLKATPESWEAVGIGFAFYISPGTPAGKAQVGGIEAKAL